MECNPGADAEGGGRGAGAPPDNVHHNEHEAQIERWIERAAAVSSFVEVLAELS